MDIAWQFLERNSFTFSDMYSTNVIQPWANKIAPKICMFFVDLKFRDFTFLCVHIFHSASAKLSDFSTTNSERYIVDCSAFFRGIAPDLYYVQCTALNCIHVQFNGLLLPFIRNFFAKSRAVHRGGAAGAIAPPEKIKLAIFILI